MYVKLLKLNQYPSLFRVVSKLPKVLCDPEINVGAVLQYIILRTGGRGFSRLHD